MPDFFPTILLAPCLPQRYFADCSKSIPKIVNRGVLAQCGGSRLAVGADEVMRHFRRSSLERRERLEFMKPPLS